MRFFHQPVSLQLPRADDRGAQSAGQAFSRYAVNTNPLPPSQRLSKTKSTGEVAKEAVYINRSLSFLEQVTGALSEKGREHVPYRSSKLTHVLKDSLGGNCQTVMIATVWGEAVHLRETLSTLKFASRMARVSNEVSVNVRQVSKKRKKRKAFTRVSVFAISLNTFSGL
jgi:kinesin family protein 6/9